ncbi:hypothetical protein IFVP22_C280053 [Vibrio parahaemolyticus]
MLESRWHSYNFYIYSHLLNNPILLVLLKPLVFQSGESAKLRMNDEITCNTSSFELKRCCRIELI